MTHRAWTCTALAPDLSGLQLLSRPSPLLLPGEIRVRVHAAALNFPDLLMTQGKYQHKPPLPFVAGMECAGEVLECAPDVSGLASGDRICYGGHGGAFVEQPDGRLYLGSLGPQFLTDGLCHAQHGLRSVL